MNGCGGTLIIIVGGVLGGKGNIVSQGSIGTPSSVFVGGYYIGGSGGGSITVLASSGGDILGFSATGGQAGYRSGLGGDGSARLLRVLSSPVISARVRDLATLTAGAVVSTWGSWTSASPNQPTYQLGTDGKYEVAFDRSLLQFMNAGTRTFNIGTNAGFTIVTHFKFTGAAVSNESLFSMSTATSSGDFLGLRRYGLAQNARFTINVGSTTIVNIGSAASISQFGADVWAVVAVRYLRIAGVGYVQLLVNNVKTSEQNIGAVTLANRTDTMTYLGKSTYTTGEGFNGSMRFAGMWDRALTDAELTGLYTSLTS